MLDPKYKGLESARRKLFRGLVARLLEIHATLHIEGNMHEANKAANQEVCLCVFSFIRPILKEVENENDIGELEFLIEYCESVLGLKTVRRTVRSNPFLLGFRIIQQTLIDLA